MRAKLIKLLMAAGVVAAGLTAAQREARAQVLFSDDFQSNTSANWLVFGASANGVTNDYSVQFAFDYSTQPYAFNGVTNFIPPSPNSSGTTKGLKVTVNKNGNANSAAVSLYPVGLSFSNDYSLKFDLWMDYNGDVAFGGVGSTEFATFGLNHLGTEVNGTISTNSGDGVWFAIDGDGGTTRDYESFLGGFPGDVEQISFPGGFLDRDVDGTGDQFAPDDGSFAPVQLMFHPPNFQTPGAIGKHWVQGEVRQRAGLITWLVDGYIIAEQSNNGGYSAGNIMIGYMDPFAEIAAPPNENYAIFDNVRVTDLTGNAGLPEINITATDANASEPGADTGTFNIARTGSTVLPLTVNLYVSGTASNGVDYVTIPTAVTIPAGSASTNVTVQVINDAIGEGPETVILAIAANPSAYDVRNNYATVTITDDNDVPAATLKATRPGAYELGRPGIFTFALSNPNGSDTTLNYTITGTASNGVDYSLIATNILVPAGQTNVTLNIAPINNSLVSSNKTVTLALVTNAGYTLGGASNGTVTIRNDDLTPGTVLFSDNFDVPSAGNWVTNQTVASDKITFAYDYSADGIPPAPHTTNGTTLGMKLEANVSAVTAAGVSASPLGGNYTGDYRVRFDMWINYNGPLFDGGSGSTEYLGAGVGTKGNVVEWSLGPAADGIWFACDGDGGSGVDYRAFMNSTHLAQGNALVSYPAGSQSVANAYYAPMGGDPAPLIQQNNFPANQTGTSGPGNPGMAWHDVVVTKQGTNITWTMDGLLLASVPASATTLSTNVFVCYYDTSSGVSPIPALSFGVVDNFKVESIAPPVITAVTIVGSNVQIDFTGLATDTIQSTAVLGTAMADVSPAATIVPLGGNSFRATTPVNGTRRFYRVRH